MDSSRVNYHENTWGWGKCSGNNKNANDLRPARDDKGIKALKTKRGCFHEVRKQEASVLFICYLRLLLRAIGRSVQTCK